MSAPLMMVLATLLFSGMGVCVKAASAHYGTGDIVLYRGLIGALTILALSRWQGVSLKTTIPAAHLWRALSGVTALSCWFWSIGRLPLATAVTLNYMSSIWMAMFLIGGAVMLGGARSRVDGRLVATVLVGFAGVALVLRPTIDEDLLLPGLVGLASGLLSAMAYLQVTALGRAGEPESRVVFYFSLGSVVAGGAMSSLGSDSAPHTAAGLAWLLAVGVLATVAQLLMTRAYATGTVLVNASLQYLGIVWSFAFGVVIFDDAVTASAVAGMLLIIGAGLAATLLRARQAPPDVARNAPDS